MKYIISNESNCFIFYVEICCHITSISESAIDHLFCYHKRKQSSKPYLRIQGPRKNNVAKNAK